MAQCWRVFCNISRVQIGVHIAATKSVNGLLGVANQEQRWLLAVGAKHAIEDAPLARIGVLKFIHQRHTVLPAQIARQRIASL